MRSSANWFFGVVLTLAVSSLVLSAHRQLTLDGQDDDESGDDGSTPLFPPHTEMHCSCGYLLAYCECESCVRTGQRQSVLSPEACPVCAQRKLAEQVGPVLELGVLDIAVRERQLLMTMRAAALALPLGHLRGLLLQADALGIADTTTVGVVLRRVEPLAPAGTPLVLGSAPDGAATVRLGRCVDCGADRLLCGPYCVPCGLAHREEQHGR